MRSPWSGCSGGGPREIGKESTLHTKRGEGGGASSGKKEAFSETGKKRPVGKISRVAVGAWHLINHEEGRVEGGVILKEIQACAALLSDFWIGGVTERETPTTGFRKSTKMFRVLEGKKTFVRRKERLLPEEKPSKGNN